MSEKEQLVMFDLDGTLIHSVGGIANSVNVTRLQYGFAPLPVETIISFTGDGAKKLLERSLADVTLPVSLEEATAAMVRNYEADPVCDTYLYEGVTETLETLRSRDVRLAVVSNKPESVGKKILSELKIASFFCDNIGGGRFPLKPAPDAFLFLMEKYAVPRENCWIVGDNHTDMDAANAIGVFSVFCRYGFGTRGKSSFRAEISRFSELPALIFG